MSKKILILNGPGFSDIEYIRQHYSPDITLEKIEKECAAECAKHDFEMSFRQSEHDDEIFGMIATDAVEYDLLIINPMGHYALEASSRLELYRVAIKALALRGVPVIEVYLNNIFQTPDNMIAPLQVPDVQIGFICGLGVQSYSMAIASLALQQAR